MCRGPVLGASTGQWHSEVRDEPTSANQPRRQRTERAGDTLVVRWVDRLGRNYTDVVDTIREFMRRGVSRKRQIGYHADRRNRAGCEMRKLPAGPGTM